MTSTSQPSGTALILGITGAIGGAIAASLSKRGWAIRALTRRPAHERPTYSFAVDWRKGDSLNRQSVIDAARGAELIVHGVNPPGYRRWREDGLPMLSHTIAAATHSTILFPANVYVFSSASPDLVDESAPRCPTTRKGQVRLEMEDMLAQAAKEGRARTIAVRAGDFFGPGVENSWFSQVVVNGGAKAKDLRVLGKPGIGHAWAYVPDLAETFAQLADVRDSLQPFEMVHFAGHYDRSGREMVDAIRRALAAPHLSIRPFRWSQVWLGAPFVPFLREALEMRWLWQTSLALDNRKLVRLIAQEPHTPIDDAVRTAMGGIA